VRPVKSLLSASAGMTALILAITAVPAAAMPGDLDSSFGQQGFSALGFPDGAALSGAAITTQPDGRIVVAVNVALPGSTGTGGTGTGSDTSGSVGLERLMPDGTPDTSFGSSGMATTTLSNTPQVREVAMAPGGAIVVLVDTVSFPGGSADPTTINVSSVLLRYTSSGKPDTTFGTNGQVALSQQALASGMVVQGDGSIVAAVVPVPSSTAGTGGTTLSGSVVRITPTGQSDPTFGTAGAASLPGAPSAVAADANGNLVVAELTGSSDSPTSAVVQRLSGQGITDPTFGSAGSATLPQLGTVLQPGWVTVSASGIYVTADSLGLNETDVVRLTASGSVDTTFGRQGVIGLSAPLAAQRVSAESLSSAAAPLVLHGLIGDSVATWMFGAAGAPMVGYGHQGVASAPLPSGGTATGTGGVATAADGGVLAPVSYFSSATVSSGAFQETSAVAKFVGGAAPGGTQTNVTVRLAGADRVATAVAVSQALFGTVPQSGATGTTNSAGQPVAGAVVLASADSYPDALVSVPLAAQSRAPLLLTHQASLDQRDMTEIQRVIGNGSGAFPGQIYVVGGTAAVSDQVVGQLASAGYQVHRISGANRFATAVAVAGQLGDPPVAIEATGTDFPDALSAGSAAAHDGGAVLLTSGSTMPAETQAYLSAHQADIRFAIGGPASQADPAAKSIAGADRYATSAAVAATFFATPAVVGLATGLQYADALPGAVGSALLGGPLVLSDPNALPTSVGSFLHAIAPWAAGVQVFGGTAAVSDAVANSALQAIT